MAEVDPEPIIVVVRTREVSTIVPKFMAYANMTFEDDRAEGSDDDRPVPDCGDLSQTHQVVADGFRLDDSVPPINLDNLIIQKGIVFKTMDALKIWLAE
jgi:hypothetical protein